MLDSVKYDEIFVKGLHVKTVIGVNEWERNVPQDLYIDLILYVNISNSGKTDDILDTVDYFEVTQRIKAYVESTRYMLIETLIESISDLILGEFSVQAVSVQVDKPNALKNAESVGVKIFREKVHDL